VLNSPAGPQFRLANAALDCVMGGQPFQVFHPPTTEPWYGKNSVSLSQLMQQRDNFAAPYRANVASRRRGVDESAISIAHRLPSAVLRRRPDLAG